MLTEKMLKTLNEQVKKEAYASHLYLAMASWVENQGFEGIAEWFYAQSEEEREHMMKFIRYINERGGHAIVPVVEEPPKDFPGIKAAFEASLEHEQMVSGAINDIVALALDEKDYATNNWIQWFVEEQREEEDSVQRIIDRLEIIGDHGHGLYVFDRDIMAMRGTH